MRKRKKCDNEGCANLSHGKLCKPCDISRRSQNKIKDLKAYARYHATKKKYDIDEMDFDCLWIAQRGKCAICENDLKMPAGRRGQALDVVAIDHNHKTGNIRGLLCNGCNKGLGLFRDNLESLAKAIEYLRYCNSDTDQLLVSKGGD